MRATRRSFLGGCAAVTVAGPSVLAAESPVLKIGIVTDTHVRDDRASCRPMQAAWELFRRERTDAVFNLGDIADRFSADGYLHYRACIDEVKSGGGWNPEELYVWAFHDAYGYRGHLADGTPPRRHEAFADAARLIGSPNGEWAERELKGHPFLVFPQFLELSEYRGRYEGTIRRVCETHPGRPVFLLDHIPPVGTVQNSDIAGDWRRTEILSKYPQVVDLTGHVHGSIRNDDLIWQGEYTVINFGCMTSWTGGLVGGDVPGGVSRGAGILEVYPDQLVVRRFNDVVSAPDREEEPWTVPLPFDPARAPYSVAAKRRRPAPAFAPGSAVSFDAAAFVLEFPEAEAGGTTCLYRVAAQVRNAAGRWDDSFVREVHSQFHVDRRSRRPNRMKVDAAYFPSGDRCRFSVVPVGFGGKAGEAISAEFALPPCLAETACATCELSDPMRELDFRWAAWCEAKKPEADGFVRMKYDDEISLGFPKAAFPGPEGTRYRVTADITVDTPEGAGFRFGFCLSKPRPRWFFRGKTLSGRNVRMRLVAMCEKESDKYEILGWASLCAGRLRIDRVKVERMVV